MSRSALNPNSVADLPLFADMDGKTFDPAKDKARLNKQLQRVYLAMKDHGWCTLAEVAARAQCPEASASSRMRDLRKEKFGGYEVERRRRESDLWVYRLVMPGDKQEDSEGGTDNGWR